jgi:hypothetical protein
MVLCVLFGIVELALPRASNVGEGPMSTLLRKLNIPATESQMGIALAISIAMMSFLLWGLLWQAEIIVKQRDIIRYMGTMNGHMG